MNQLIQKVFSSQKNQKKISRLLPLLNDGERQRLNDLFLTILAVKKEKDPEKLTYFLENLEKLLSEVDKILEKARERKLREILDLDRRAVGKIEKDYQEKIKAVFKKAEKKLATLKKNTPG